MLKRTMTTAVDRRTMLAGLAATAAAASQSPAWAQAAKVPTIPKATVRFGGFPFTNHAWTILAAKKGFLADVGLTMQGGAPKSLTEPQIISQLQNGEVDIASYWWGAAMPKLDRLDDIRPVLVYSYFQGSTILAAPNSGFKTVDEFVKQGMDWKDAAAAAIGQLKGKRTAIANVPGTYPWNEYALSLGGLSMKQIETIALSDPKIVQLALNNQVDFAIPGGAVQTYQLEFQAGWKSIMSTRQMLKYLPTAAGSVVESLLNFDLMQTTASYLDKNKDTVFRFVGAMYRTIDYMFGPEQDQALTEYAPFINSISGAQMDAKSIKFIFDNLDPFFGWSDQKRIWEDPSYALNYKNVYEYQTKQFIQSGSIPNKDYNIDQTFAAKAIWQEMATMKARAELLLGKLSGSLSDDRKNMAELAKLHLRNFNFLDAQRFAEAATD